MKKAGMEQGAIVMLVFKIVNWLVMWICLLWLFAFITFTKWCEERGIEEHMCHVGVQINKLVDW